MNADRRKQIERAQALLLKIEGVVQEAAEILTEAHADEEQYYGNMPEGLQNGEKGERAYEAVEALDKIKDACEGFVDVIGETDWDAILA